MDHPLPLSHSPAPLTSHPPSSTRHSPSHTLPHSTRHTPTQYNQSHSEHPTGEATQVPSSLVCDLTTGQLYSTAPEPARQPGPTAPPPPASHWPPVRKSSGHRAIPPQTKMTSFSRELSRRPMAVLRRTELERPSPSHPPHHTSLTTPLTPPLMPHPPSLPRPSHSVRYPLGNPVVPRAPLPPPPPNPLLTCSQGSAQMREEREKNQIENSFLRVCPMPSTGLVTLVTLHSSGPVQASRQPVAVRVPSMHTLARPFSEETLPTPPPKARTPPSFSPPPSPSCSPPAPPRSPACVSPDHMHVGALICGGQLVLDSGGEQVVHPLREGSSTSVASGNTPSPLGGGNGMQAPPPTATDGGGDLPHGTAEAT